MQGLPIAVRDTLCGRSPIINAPVVKFGNQRNKTTQAVLKLLLNSDLSECNADTISQSLGMSSSTLRRRLKEDSTCFSYLSDRARQYRCEQRLKERWLPGKSLAYELGYTEPNSFYRAFKRWTGLPFREYKRRLH